MPKKVSHTESAEAVIASKKCQRKSLTQSLFRPLIQGDHFTVITILIQLKISQRSDRSPFTQTATIMTNKLTNHNQENTDRLIVDSTKPELLLTINYC